MWYIRLNSSSLWLTGYMTDERLGGVTEFQYVKQPFCVVGILLTEVLLLILLRVCISDSAHDTDPQTGPYTEQL